MKEMSHIPEGEQLLSPNAVVGPAERAEKGRTSGQAAAAAAHPAATEAAVEILRAGGNAVDAAVAAAWALSVCEPSGSGLGGQTTILICLPDSRKQVVDGHSSAPKRVSRSRVSRSQQKRGYRACTIPTTAATLGFAQERYGSLPLSVVMQPAIRLAEEGFPITNLLRRQISWCRSSLADCPVASRLLLKRGRPREAGEILRQKKLGKTLRRLARSGTEDFYRGKIAREIVRDMNLNGGLITRKDLAACLSPIVREPLATSYRGYRVLSAPPPGGGLQVLLGLRILDELLPSGPQEDALLYYELLAETIRAVFRERDRWPVHPDSISASQVQWLLSEERASEIVDLILKGNYDPPGGACEEPGETTHVCTTDARGTVVSLTQSIQSLFGAKVVHPRLGFFYNNYLYTCPRHSHPYELTGGCLPQSNAAPTVVFKEAAETGRQSPVFAAGAAGSRRITSAVLHVITGVIDRGLSLSAAVDAPRVHALVKNKVWIERRLAGEDLLKRFGERFGKVVVKSRRSYAMGAVQAVGLDENGEWTGAADRRREGCSAVCDQETSWLKDPGKRFGSPS